jgi:hypothetical protein
MPPDPQLSTSLWKRALGFFRVVWVNFRARELSWGVFAGSVAAAVAPGARAGFVRLWTIIYSKLPTSVADQVVAPGIRAPVIAALFALFAMILPRFGRKTICLWHSWSAGLVRGVGLFGRW